MSRTNANPSGPSFGVTCPCGKLRFASRRDAKNAIRRMKGCGRGGPHLNPYRCGDFWHIGNLPRAVVTGDVTRAEVSRPTPEAPREQR